MNISRLSIHSPSIKYGLIAGACYVIGVGLLHLMSDIVMVMAKPIPFLIAIAIAIYAGVEEKKAFGGYISFSHAFLTIFLAILIAEICWNIFMYVLYNFIDPTLPERVRIANVNTSIWLMEKMGTEQEMINERIRYTEALNFRISFMDIITNMLSAAAVGFLISLISAAIIKREKKSESPD